MFDHITEPKRKYRSPDDVKHILYTGKDGNFSEPYLGNNSVQWQYGAAGYRANGTVGSADIWRTPALGGKLTVCVLCHGPFFGLHQRCLESIRKTVPREFMDLRVGLVEVGEKTRRYIERQEPDKVYDCTQPANKYTMMRKLLWDADKPITTPYVAWFDDTAAVANANWLWSLGSTILKQTLPIGMYGLKLYTMLPPSSGSLDWFKSAEWYKGKLFRDAAGTESINGRVIHYCAGWFWCASVEALRRCDIPCSRLIQRGGEMVIGEQLHQGGYILKQFNGGQAFVKRLPQTEIPRKNPVSRFPWQ